MCCKFLYRSPHMDLGIPIWKRWSPFPYGDLTQMDPRYHMGIPMWERGLTYSYMEMVNHRFRMGIENLWLCVSIWGLPYGNGKWRVPISIRGLSVTIWGFDTNGSPMGGSRYGNGDSHIPLNILPNTVGEGLLVCNTPPMLESQDCPQI